MISSCCVTPNIDVKLSRIPPQAERSTTMKLKIPDYRFIR